MALVVLQARCPSRYPTNGVKALKETLYTALSGFVYMTSKKYNSE